MPFYGSEKGQPSTAFRHAIFRVTFLAAATAWSTANAQDDVLPRVPETGLVHDGYELSKLHCARCHIVHPNDRFTGHASTPSFMIMIDYLQDWPDRFDTFMARNPHPAHMRLEGSEDRPEHLPATISEVILTLDEIEAILVYVDFLAEDLGKPRPD